MFRFQLVVIAVVMTFVSGAAPYESPTDCCLAETETFHCKQFSGDVCDWRKQGWECEEQQPSWETKSEQSILTSPWFCQKRGSTNYCLELDYFLGLGTLEVFKEQTQSKIQPIFKMTGSQNSSNPSIDIQNSGQFKIKIHATPHKTEKIYIDSIVLRSSKCVQPSSSGSPEEGHPATPAVTKGTLSPLAVTAEGTGSPLTVTAEGTGWLPAVLGGIGALAVVVCAVVVVLLIRKRKDTNYSAVRREPSKVDQPTDTTTSSTPQDHLCKDGQQPQGADLYVEIPDIITTAAKGAAASTAVITTSSGSNMSADHLPASETYCEVDSKKGEAAIYHVPEETETGGEANPRPSAHGREPEDQYDCLSRRAGGSKERERTDGGEGGAEGAKIYDHLHGGESDYSHIGRGKTAGKVIDDVYSHIA